MYHPQLDGLRAVAVASVAWSHWERPYQFGLPFGAGVHLFFVLSGFLITRILLDIGARERGAALGVFYVRRALRIFPAFYLTLALAWLADVPPVRETLAWHATYLTNVWIVAHREWPGAISHLWSLAVEEQFYLVWPWLIVFTPRRRLVPVVLAAILAAPLFRWWLAAAGFRETLLAVLMPGSLDSLGAGALLAVVWADSSTRQAAAFSGKDSFNRLAFAAALGWITLIAGAGLGATWPLWLVAIKQTLQAAVFAWIVWRAAAGFDGVTGRVLAAPLVVAVGRISYGVYLAHGLIGELFAVAGFGSADLPEPLRLVTLVTATLAVAALSWHFVEAPLNALKDRFPYPRARQTTQALLRIS